LGCNHRKKGEWEGAQLGQIRCKKGERKKPGWARFGTGREKRPHCLVGGLLERNWLAFLRLEEKRTCYFV